MASRIEWARQHIQKIADSRARATFLAESGYSGREVFQSGVMTMEKHLARLSYNYPRFDARGTLRHSLLFLNNYMGEISGHNFTGNLIVKQQKKEKRFIITTHVYAGLYALGGINFEYQFSNPAHGALKPVEFQFELHKPHAVSRAVSIFFTGPTISVTERMQGLVPLPYHQKSELVDSALDTEHILRTIGTQTLRYFPVLLESPPEFAHEFSTDRAWVAFYTPSELRDK